MKWTEWESPWTRSSGALPGYGPVSDRPHLFDAESYTFAVRQSSRPYLPTFAPWWAGLSLIEVKDGSAWVLPPDNDRPIELDLASHPWETHWAAAHQEDNTNE